MNNGTSSYASVTAAGLYSLLLIGVEKSDPRVQAAYKWLTTNYTLDVNPGFSGSKDPTEPYQGLYYYLHTMAKALSLYGEEEIVDASGRKNPWRKQLSGRIVSMQNKTDGSWSNQNAARWYEGNPVLATSYALLALDLALPH
jgi:squalene-hopene/tetraprenyl-beta-curcumene cyclase